MSAHLCLIAWKEPIGRPNCTRSLAYCTAISSTSCPPPTCSAASATTARSNTVEIVSQPVPSVPIKVAGTPAYSKRACLRVWSIVDSAVRVSPAASPSTANRLTPASVRAAVMIRLAMWPSRTYNLVPSMVQESPDLVAVAVIADSSQRPLGSV